ARQVLEMGDSDEIKSTLSTAKKAFGLYKDAIVSRNTSRSTFKIEDLMYGQTPTTLYIITQEADKERLRPLTRVLLALMVRMLTPKQVIVDGELIKTFNQRLLFLIDEFPDLGRIDAIESILATAAGFGLKFMFFAQGIPQLRVPKKGYGPDETITLGCQVKIFFTPADDRTAEIVSKATGETTVVNKEVTVSGKKGLFGGDTSVSTSYSQNKRVLLTEDEVLRLPSGVYDKNDPLKLVEPGDTLIQVTGRPMIYGKQILYWDYPYFLDAKATKTPPDQNYVRVAWFDRLGNPRHSLMRQADADELCRALEADLAATPPPVGIGNRWAPPGSAPLGSIDGADMSNHGPVLGGSAPGAAVSALSVSPSALFARPGGQGSSPPPRSIKR
ncbi:MAG: type IV secretory system conjugative DNA transfer family protein, partial [Janthinobacterium lividum]